MKPQIINIQHFKTTYGELVLGSFGEELCLCDWRYRKMRSSIDKRIQQGLEAEYSEENSELIQIANRQLEEYFAGDRKVFDVPIRLVGSEFQKSVWNQLLTIPYGQRETYLGLAKRLGNPLAIRAVAGANGDNALSIIVPCHRIVGSDGKLTGYAGGLPTKKRLLQLESKSNQTEELTLFPGGVI